MLKVLILGLLIITSTFADTMDVLEDNVGWTIISVKTIEGYKDKDKKPVDSFEGCDYDRKIYFSDNTHVECRTYSYSYSYRPKAVILGKSIDYNGKKFNTYRMIVDGNDYDVSIGR